MNTLEQAVTMYLTTEDITLTKIQSLLQISYKKIKEELEALGYYIPKGASRTTVIGLKNAVDEYKNDQSISLSKLA